MSRICKSCGKYFDGDYCNHCGYGKKDIKTKAAEKYKKNTTPVRFMTDEEKKKYYDRQRESIKHIFTQQIYHGNFNNIQPSQKDIIILYI